MWPAKNFDALWKLVIHFPRIAPGGTTVLKAWYGRTVPDGASIADVYAGFSFGQLDKNLPIPEEYQAAVDVKVGKCRTDQMLLAWIVQLLK